MKIVDCSALCNYSEELSDRIILLSQSYSVWLPMLFIKRSEGEIIKRLSLR